MWKKSFLSSLIPALAIFFMLAGCSDDDTDDLIQLEEKIRGMWVNTHVDDEPVLTNEAFMTDYHADFSQLYAIGLNIDQDNRAWFENTNYTYSVEEEMIIVEGPDVFGDEFYMEFDIHEIDDEHMRYTVPTFTINGESHPDPHTYTLEKVTDDHLEDLQGTWHALSTSADGDHTEYYWNYAENGTYDIYYQDDEGNWLLHANEYNQYFLYGELLVMNFHGGPLSGNHSQDFIAWNIDIHGDSMTWTALRENDEIHSFELQRVEEPPL